MGVRPLFHIAVPTQSVPFMQNNCRPTLNACVMVPRPSVACVISGVQCRMFRLTHNFKIFRTIITRIAVSVVNDLITSKVSTKYLLHNQTMLCYIAFRISSGMFRAQEIHIPTANCSAGSSLNALATKIDAITDHRTVLRRRPSRYIRLLANGTGKIVGHWKLLTSGVNAGAVPAAPGFIRASILPCIWGKEAS